MKVPPKIAHLIAHSARRSWLLIAIFAGFILFFVHGCSWLDSSPVQKQSLPEKKNPSIFESQQKTLQDERLRLLDRVKQLEIKLQQNQLEYESRLKDMDRTILLLEENISKIKNSVREIDRRQPAKENDKPKNNRIQAVSKPTSKTPAPKKNTNLIGEMRTPETSKALETVSLLNPVPKKNKPTRKTKKSKRNSLKIVGIDSVKKNKKSPFIRQAWEDPDLNEPLSPIQLKVVSGAKRRYQQAFKIYSNRNYSESIKQFNRFVIDFSSDQDADNSQFWIGQSHFQLGNYLQAERSFRKVLKNYPHGSTRRGYKTPDATLMLGRIYLIRKKPIKAIYYFDEVVQRYPDSRSAVKAKKEIQAMNSF